jgi:hypothetical protein
LDLSPSVFREWEWSSMRGVKAVINIERLSS